MVRIAIVLVFIFPASISGFAQFFEFRELTKLPTTVNSRGEESMPLLSADQTKLFFVRSVYDGNNGGKYGGQDIWCSEKTAAGWKAASNSIPYLNNKDNNVLIGINQDGRTLYTLRSSPSEKLNGLYFSKLSGTEWTKPEFVPLPGIDNEDFVGMFVAADYDVIFITMRGTDSRGEEDIYISLKDRAGAWGKPRNLGPTINTNGFEISPFLSSDKKRLYFASNGLGGLGDADIFYCERLYNSWETWSAPVNLGDVVNSKKFDAYFSIYGDSVAFFASNRDQQLSDIFSVKVSEKIGLLPAGYRYLTQDEWNASIGKNVLRKLTFEPEVTTLTSAQKELLYYISNKVSAMSDVSFHIIVREEENPDFTRSRLKAIYGELRQHGMDSNRIREEQNPQAIKTGKSGVIELMLYKEEPR
jgi:hypothetical protein